MASHERLERSQAPPPLATKLCPPGGWGWPEPGTGPDPAAPPAAPRRTAPPPHQSLRAGGAWDQYAMVLKQTGDAAVSWADQCTRRLVALCIHHGYRPACVQPCAHTCDGRQVEDDPSQLAAPRLALPRLRLGHRPSDTFPQRLQQRGLGVVGQRVQQGSYSGHWSRHWLRRWAHRAGAGHKAPHPTSAPSRIACNLPSRPLTTQLAKKTGASMRSSSMPGSS